MVNADAVLLTDDPSQLQPALQCLEEEASKLGLHVSWAKTKVQNLGSGHEAAPIQFCLPRLHHIKRIQFAL